MMHRYLIINPIMNIAISTTASCYLDNSGECFDTSNVYIGYWVTYINCIKALSTSFRSLVAAVSAVQRNVHEHPASL